MWAQQKRGGVVPFGGGRGGDDHQAKVAAAGLEHWFACRQNCGEDAEEQVAATRGLLSEIYERKFADEEAWSVLSSCPEIGWLVECYCRAPLPPSWRKSQLAAGDAPMFANEETGVVTVSPPWFKYFVRLAQLVLRARLVPSGAGQAKYIVRTILQETRALAGNLEASWTGPHIDPTEGAEYFHCPATGVSVWDNPSAWAKFVVSVAEKLLESDAFTGVVDCAPPIASPAKSTAEEQQPQGPEAKDTKRMDGPISPVCGALAQGGEDAWGALDALIADFGPAPDSPKAPAGMAAPKAQSWSEMQNWIASQKQTKARPAVASVPSPSRSSVAAPSSGPPVPAAEAPEASIEKRLDCFLQQRAPPAVAKPWAPAASVKAKKVEASGGGYPAAKSTKPLPPAPAPAAAPAPAPVAAPAASKKPLPPAPAPVAATPLPPAPAPVGAPVAAPYLKAASKKPQPRSWDPEEAMPLSPEPEEEAVAPYPEEVFAGAGGSRAELQRLADRLSTVAAEDNTAICSILEALERVPVTMNDLKETKLGVLTQPYKDSADKKVKVVARRLRVAWKDTLKKSMSP